jgi:chitosanase
MVVVAWLRSLLCVLVALVAMAFATAVPAGASPALTPVQRNVADQLVSVFENSTTDIRYGYIENLRDGCGFTAGRAGFCTATGDLLKVVELYAASRPGADVVTFLPVLRARAIDRSASVRSLGDDFITAWQTAAQDATFRAAQDDIVDAEYFTPAVRMTGDAALTSALAVAIFYDTAIEHGVEHDYDGLPALIARTRHRVGGLPGKRITERRWLSTFLKVRRADLLHPHNHARQVDWPDSVGRVDALARLVHMNRLGLRPPLAVNPWGDHTFMLEG